MAEWLVEFLNEQMPRVEVLAVEIRQYRAPGSVAGALVPRLVGQTARARPGKQQAASAARRTTRWALGEVLEVIARAGSDAALVAGSICHWAEAQPHIRVSGGTGVAYPSVTLSADSGRDRSRWRGVLVVAYTSGARVGQFITLDMAAGPVKARVIGIDTGQNNSGSIVCFPLTALQPLTARPARPTPCG